MDLWVKLHDAEMSFEQMPFGRISFEQMSLPLASDELVFENNSGFFCFFHSSLLKYISLSSNLFKKTFSFNLIKTGAKKV
jgi:hypothetical protein